MENKKKVIINVAIVAVLAVSVAPIASFAMGRGGGAGNGGRVGAPAQNMIDSDDDGTPDGLEDDDGDGIINRDDPDYEKQYVNMKDDDGDGIPNKDDEDYTRPLDGSGRPETAGQGNRPEAVGAGQGTGRMNNVQAQQQNRVNANGAGQQNRVRLNNPALTEQLELVTEQQDQLEQEIADDIEAINQTSGLKRFFFGADRDVVNRAQTKLIQQERRVEQMKQVLETVEDPQVQAAIEDKIQEIEETNAQLQEEIESEQGGIFSWFTNLFN